MHRSLLSGSLRVLCSFLLLYACRMKAYAPVKQSAPFTQTSYANVPVSCSAASLGCGLTCTAQPKSSE